MSLVDPLFVTFVAVVLAVCLAVGRRRQWPVLLVASYAFAASSGPLPLLVLAAVTLSTWSCGLAVAPGAPGHRRAVALGIGIAVPLVALVGLKDLGFLAQAVGAAGRLLGAHLAAPAVPTLAAVGLSYYVLQAIAYLVDVHEEAIPPERHLGRFALSLAFFPKLVQGPIERGEALLPQLRAPAPVAAGDLQAGLELVLWGLFQKTVVADRLAPLVAAAYGDLPGHAGLGVLVATYLFAAQLYLDFAGYTDVAIGIARLFGIRLSQNFRAPYLASSVADFWRRWHVSFSSWLLDYVFRRLQLRLRAWRTFGTPLALLVTFLLSGLWHGAAWTFVVWGGIHGVLLAGSTLRRALRPLARASAAPPPRWREALRVVATFHLVCLSWVFFRARSVGEAARALWTLPAGLAADAAHLLRGGSLLDVIALGQGGASLLVALGLVAACAALRGHFRAVEAAPLGAPGHLPRPVVATGVAALYGVMFYLVAFGGSRTEGFIYAQF